MRFSAFDDCAGETDTSFGASSSTSEGKALGFVGVDVASCIVSISGAGLGELILTVDSVVVRRVERVDGVLAATGRGASDRLGTFARVFFCGGGASGSSEGGSDEDGVGFAVAAERARVDFFGGLVGSVVTSGGFVLRVDGLRGTAAGAAGFFFVFVILTGDSGAATGSASARGLRERVARGILAVARGGDGAGGKVEEGWFAVSRGMNANWRWSSQVGANRGLATSNVRLCMFA